MARRPSAAMVQAMVYILDANMTPYAAAKRAGISLGTMYKSYLYKLWRDGHIEELKREMDQCRPRPRKKTKKEKWNESNN